MSQNVLPGLPEPRFDPRKHKLWAKYIDGGQIVHGQWLRAIAENAAARAAGRAEGVFVGTCRRCGEGLIPQAPYDVSSSRTDYQADCRDVEGCGWVCAIPRGHYLPGSTRQSEQYQAKGTT